MEQAIDNPIPQHAMKLLPALFLIFGLAPATSGYGAEKYDPSLTAWKVIVLPDKSDEEAYYSIFRRANYYSHEWVVNNVDGKVVARLRTEPPLKLEPFPDFDSSVRVQISTAEASRMLKVPDGWIAAYNLGEFGAAVYWFSPNGTKKEMLSEHQINDVLIEGERIFAVEGLAHLGMSNGSMIEIRKIDGRWSVEEFVALPGSGEAITRIGEGDFAVVTSSALLRVSLQKEMRMLVPDAGWGGLYPNSIATDGEFLYIGMRKFVARCKISTRVERFDLLIPDLKWLNSQSE
jgi:hypothetical protein